jgi:hypothetical protein
MLQMAFQNFTNIQYTFIELLSIESLYDTIQFINFCSIQPNIMLIIKILRFRNNLYKEPL